jgi:serine/threonine protein kinase
LRDSTTIIEPGGVNSKARWNWEDRLRGRTILVLKDSGGEPLDLVLERDQGHPLDLTRVLRISLGLASAVGQVHQHGLIHKDITPGNVLVNDAGNVWLTGFGIASQLPRERQAPNPPEIIVGKSSVVNELHKVLVPPRGLFASGKFDQFKRNILCATLAQGFQMLVRQILVKSEAEVDHWRHTLLEALGRMAN